MGGFETRDAAKLSEHGILRAVDHVASESPLSIVVESARHGIHELGITMRTEGHDNLLTLGFLYSEGIISSSDEIERLDCNGDLANVKLNGASLFDPSKHCRRGTVTSSCGICGRSHISNDYPESTVLDEVMEINLETVRKCLNSVIELQDVFSMTGGTHACASFTADGAIDRVFEDVGRHNAFDKLVGSYIESGRLPDTGLGAFVSGRASLELVQKSIRAGFPIMIAVGAPSTLAVDLSNEYGLTLGCFAKDESITLFSGVRRVSE